MLARWPAIKVTTQDRTHGLEVSHPRAAMSETENLQPAPLRPKKRFGQHFLISPTVLDGILRLAELTSDDMVLEIGAGTGTLTAAMAGRVRRLLAIELDRDLIVPLRQRFARQPQVEIIHADALHFDLTRLDEPVKVVANLPYGTAVPIVMRLLEAASRLRLAVVMLQREVAERLCAKPGTKAYGSLTLMAQWYAVVAKGFNVPPSAFSPPPKVISTVIKLTPRPQPPVPVQDAGWLFRVIRGGFGQRRKTLVNALAAAFQRRIEPHALRQILAKVGIDAGRRGETLTLLEYARLADALREALNSGREAIHG